MARYIDTELVYFYEDWFANFKYEYIRRLCNVLENAFSHFAENIRWELYDLYEICIDKFYEYRTKWYSRRDGGETDTSVQSGCVGIGTGTGVNLYGLLDIDIRYDYFPIVEEYVYLPERIKVDILYGSMVEPAWMGNGIPDNEKIFNMIVEDGLRFKTMEYSLDVDMNSNLLGSFSASGSISEIFDEYYNAISDRLLEYYADELYSEFYELGWR